MKLGEIVIAVNEYSDVDVNTRQAIELYLVNEYTLDEDDAYELSFQYNNIYLRSIGM